MKRIISVILVFVLCFSLAACDKKENTDTGANNQNTENTNTVFKREEGANIITGYKAGDLQLPTYKGLTYTPLSTEPTEEEIEDRLNKYASSYKVKTEITDRDVVQKGDIIDIEYVGKKDGEAFEGGTGSNANFTVGSSGYIADFENGIIGKSKGTFTIDATFPESYKNADLAGQKVTFDITIKGIYEYVTPELTDAFIAEKTDKKYETVDAYKEYVKETIRNEKKEEATMQKEYDIVRQLIDTTTFNIDLTEEINRTVSNLKSYNDQMSKSSYGVDGAGFYRILYGWDSDRYENYIKETADFSVKYEYIRSAIVEAENFEVTDEEIDTLTKSLMSSYGYGNVDDFFAVIKSNNGVEGKDYVREQVKLNKAADLIFNTAVPETGAESGETTN